MRLKEILRASLFSAPAAGAPPDDAKINFALETQTGSNWCWAAVTLSIAKSHGAPHIATQCQIVQQALPACPDCTQLACDIPGDVVNALTLEGINSIHHGGAPNFGTIFDELRGGRVVVCLVRKEPGVPGSLPHAVVISAANRPNQIIGVQDPAPDRYYGQDWYLVHFADHCIGHILIS
jgi:hypothetical protein